MEMNVIKYLCFAEYVGKSFCGWQNQGKPSNQPTVSGALEDTLRYIIRKPIDKGFIKSFSLQGSSRTDSGVHAISNAFHIEFTTLPNFVLIQPTNLVFKFNQELKKANHLIRVKRIEEVSPDFHARFNALYRKYIYKIYIGQSSVFLENYYWVIDDIDREKLCQAVEIFKNPINPVNLCRPDEKRPIDEQMEIETWVEAKENVIEIHFKSIRFFWHQIRYMTGALVGYASNKITQEEFEGFFKGKENKKPKLAPSAGLYLAEVAYP
ncbi:unnamed protein product [Blepharisma stoltei]|uniref:tRNA pseudouridine synthase n=1 Tax=Blepharisma stoltei TaxID=1481888 RepID=A0AAU9K9E7_9CILI|nr:unnamed protein product [Blepharisma stoltei]